jgi:hypothetical protein
MSRKLSLGFTTDAWSTVVEAWEGSHIRYHRLFRVDLPHEHACQSVHEFQVLARDYTVTISDLSQ